MKDSKLLKILLTLEESELASLGLFLNSPFFKTAAHVEHLFQVIMTFFPNLETLSRELVYKRAFPTRKKYNKEFLNNVLSKLLKQTELFMAHRQVQSDELVAKKLTLQFYKNKNLFQHFEKKTNELTYEIEKNPINDTDKHLSKFQLIIDYYFHPGTSKYYPGMPAIKEAEEQLDLFYFGSKLKLITESVFRKKLLGEKLQTSFLIETIKFSKKQNSPVYKMYLSIYKMVTSQEESTKYFNTAFRLFKKYQQTVSFDSQMNLLQLLLNQANELTISNGKYFRKKQLELFKIGVSQKLFFINDQIHDQQFINIVITGSILKDFAFVEKFIKEQKYHLAPVDRKDTVQLCKTFIYFHKGYFLKADELFVSSDLRKPVHKLLANSLHLRCLFELAITSPPYKDVFLGFATNFRKQISRSNLLNSQRKESYYNLIQITRILIRNSNKPKPQNKQVVTKVRKILTQKVIAKEWLEKKVSIILDIKI